MTGENDAPTLCIELRPHPQAHLVGLPAKQLRVNRLHEGVHAIETLWCRAGRQPFEIAVGTRDITVRAGRDVDDDSARLGHESDLGCQEPGSIAPICHRGADRAMPRRSIRWSLSGPIDAP